MLCTFSNKLSAVHCKYKRKVVCSCLPYYELFVAVTMSLPGRAIHISGTMLGSPRAQFSVLQLLLKTSFFLIVNLRCAGG